ncbi:MAG: VWA domain-containing protein [Planctomycetes bacterium]|nr:VWA domain-containing protein [Planctomycetota bacterium]
MIALVWLLPSYWPLLLLVPLLALWLWRRTQADRARRDAQLGANGVRLVGRFGWLRLRTAAGAVVVLLLVLVGLQPVGVGAVVDDGADVVLCVDLSASMAARDVAPSRLGRVQQEVAALAAAAPGARFGLVAYAGAAELRCPRTTDLPAVVAMVQELVPGTTGKAGTDPGAAIERAAALLRSGDGGAIVVLGDGEDFAGNGSAAAAAARARGAVVHTVGCGDPAGSKIVVDGEAGEQFLRAADGSEVVSRLELASLQAIAAAGGGECRRTADELVLPRLYAERILPRARELALRAGRLQPVHRHHVLLLIAILLWMLSWCLPERRR